MECQQARNDVCTETCLLLKLTVCYTLLYHQLEQLVISYRHFLPPSINLICIISRKRESHNGYSTDRTLDDFLALRTFYGNRPEWVHFFLLKRTIPENLLLRK